MAITVASTIPTIRPFKQIFNYDKKDSERLRKTCVQIVPDKKPSTDFGAPCRTLLFCCDDLRCEITERILFDYSRQEISFHFCFAYLRSGKTREGFAN